MRINYDKPVWVYRNLRHGRRTRPLYSVMQGGRVIRRSHRILLTNVRFVVRESGRQRVLRERRKNAHAFAVGKIAGSALGIDRHGKFLPVPIGYNPYSGPSFYNIECGRPSDTSKPISKPVKGARAVLLNENGMSAAYLEN